MSSYTLCCTSTFFDDICNDNDDDDIDEFILSPADDHKSVNMVTKTVVIKSAMIILMIRCTRQSKGHGHGFGDDDDKMYPTVRRA